MKRSLSLATVALLVLGFSSVASAQGIEVLKGEKRGEVGGKSQIKFVSEAPAEKITGTSEKLSGAFSINLDDLSKTKGSIQLPVESMDTGNKLRDKHLAGDEWLNAKKNPNVIFTIDSLADVKVGAAEKDKQVFTASAVGKVNVNGVEAPSKAAVTVTVLASGKLKIEITKLSVKLADHKVEGKKGSVGSKVGETIEITGLIYADLK